MNVHFYKGLKKANFNFSKFHKKAAGKATGFKKKKENFFEKEKYPEKREKEIEKKERERARAQTKIV